jgi:hypothetical protein
MTDRKQHLMSKQLEAKALEMVAQVLNPTELKEQLVTEGVRRELLQKFIKDNLSEGVDYGRIHIATKERCQKPWDCTNDKHFSKPCLFKPGAEKFCSLLQLRADFTADKETLEMVGNPTGLIAFRCTLTQIATGLVVAEGRGTCTVSEKGGLVNTTVKIAEKRAHIDAVLRLGLSDSFTQDLEDMKEIPEAASSAPAITTPKALREDPATKKQLDEIKLFSFVKRADMKKIKEYVETEFATKFEQITREQAERVMSMLVKKYGVLEQVTA